MFHNSKLHTLQKQVEKNSSWELKSGRSGWFTTCRPRLLCLGPGFTHRKWHVCPYREPHQTTSSGSQNCCESRIMFSRTSVFMYANVASRIWWMEYYQLCQNPELHKSLQTSTKFPFPAHVSNSGVWNLCHIYYWRFRASNLETLTQLTLGSPQTTGPLTAWRTLIWWRHVKGLKNCLSLYLHCPKIKHWWIFAETSRMINITLPPQAVCLVALHFLQGSPIWVVKPIPLHGPGGVSHMYMARS